MPETRILLVAISTALLLLAGAAAADAALHSAGEQYDVQKESWTPNAGNVTALNQSNLDGVRYDRHVNVWDENATKMVDGEDYEWFHTNGTVKALTGGRLDGDASAEITYGYVAPTGVQSGIASTIAGGVDVAGLFVLVAIAGFIVTALAALGRL